MDDKTIVALFFRRSEEAIPALAAQYGPRLRRLARNILRSERDAEECVNDTWLAVWNSIPPQRPQSLAAYVLALGRNTALRRYHKNTARKRNSFYDTALDELADCLAAAETAESALEARELGRQINDFLETLPREDRVMFLRRYWFADSVADIAKAMGTGTNRVSVRLHRTREKLRAYLTERGTVL